MRKLIIDTDTAGDDAVALIMAQKSPEIDILGVTVTAGNVKLDQAVQNALASLEAAGGRIPPVYPGAGKPLMRDLITSKKVHGEDGMGDADLIHPQGKAETKHGADAILDMLREHPGEAEILAIGPVTNLAMAYLKEPETFGLIKHVYSMGSAGFGPGNITPVAEFNAYADAEAYKILLDSGILITVVGFDVCLGDSTLEKDDLERLLKSPRREARFAALCNQGLRQFNIRRAGKDMADLPDAVALGVLLWEDIIEDAPYCLAEVCTKEEAAYGQVIFNDGGLLATSEGFADKVPHIRVCRKLNQKLFKERLMALLLADSPTE